MDIYFAGSIRGGRSDVELYAELIEILADHGTVLSEHVGKRDVEQTEQEAGLTDGEIHGQDMAWLRQADVVIAEVTTPSLGVGYELGKAVEWEKPICCLYRPGTEHDLSAMIRGSPTADLIEYSEPAQIEAELTAFVQQNGN